MRAGSTLIFAPASRRWTHFGVIFGERSHFAQAIDLRVDSFFGAFKQHVDLRRSGARADLDRGGHELRVQNLAQQLLHRIADAGPRRLRCGCVWEEDAGGKSRW